MDEKDVRSIVESVRKAAGAIEQVHSSLDAVREAFGEKVGKELKDRIGEPLAQALVGVVVLSVLLDSLASALEGLQELVGLLEEWKASER